MKGHKNTGKKENNGLKSKKGNIILLVLLLLILLVVPCFALGASIGDDVKVHFNSSEQVSSERLPTLFPVQQNLLQKYRHKSPFLPNLSVKLRLLLPQTPQREPLKYWIQSKEKYLK